MMRKLLACALLLAAAAGPASAAGLNLGWVDCAGVGAGPGARTFACNTNGGAPHIMIGSFVAPAGLTEVTGFAAVLDLQTANATLPDWWNIGGCRVAGAMSHTASFAAGPFSCLNYWAGQASGAGVYIIGPPKQARIKEGWALAPSNPDIGPIAADEEAYAFQILINNSRSTGLGACAGCSFETCIVFNEILVTNRPGNPNGNITIINPATRAHVTWQGWTNPDPQQACPDVTPAINRTWGSIKAIYR